MRGHQSPCRKVVPTELQLRFQSLSRHRRAQVTEAARTNLVIAHRWARAEHVAPEVATALEGALAKLKTK
jgi:hypothetical protein